MNDDAATPVVTMFHTQSSSLSSQFEVGRESSDHLEGNSQSDLNDTVKTFHDRVESETVGHEERKSENATSQQLLDALDNNTVAGIPSVDPAQEDMPSFHEWTEKRLAKEGKKERGAWNYFCVF